MCQCCVFKATQCFQTPFWAVYLSAAGPRGSLYSVNGRLETISRIWMKFGPSFKESTSKTSLKFAWNLSTRLPASPYGKKDDAAGQLIFGSSFVETQAFVENKVHFKPGAIFAADQAVSMECCYNSLSNLGTSTKMCPTGEIHGKPLARNKPHTPTPG